MQVDYQLTEEDVLAFQRYHIDDSSKSQPSPRRSLWLALIVLLLGVALIYLRAQAKLEFRIGLLGVLLASGFVFSIYLFRHRLNARALRRQLRRGELAKVMGPERLEISPDGCTRTSEFGTGTTFWKGVEKIVVTKDHAFFYLTKTTVFVLPRHAFRDEWEFTEFVDTAKRYHDAAVRSTDSTQG